VNFYSTSAKTRVTERRKAVGDKSGDGRSTVSRFNGGLESGFIERYSQHRQTDGMGLEDVQH